MTEIKLGWYAIVKHEFGIPCEVHLTTKTQELKDKFATLISKQYATLMGPTTNHVLDDIIDFNSSPFTIEERYHELMDDIARSDKYYIVSIDDTGSIGKLVDAVSELISDEIDSEAHINPETGNVYDTFKKAVLAMYNIGVSRWDHTGAMYPASTIALRTLGDKPDYPIVILSGGPIGIEHVRELIVRLINASDAYEVDTVGVAADPLVVIPVLAKSDDVSRKWENDTMGLLLQSSDVTRDAGLRKNVVIVPMSHKVRFHPPTTVSSRIVYNRLTKMVGFELLTLGGTRIDTVAVLVDDLLYLLDELGGR